MKTLKTFRTTIKSVNKTLLLDLSNEHIIKNGGIISFDWYCEQVGGLVTWTCKGYIDDQPIKIIVDNI